MDQLIGFEEEQALCEALRVIEFQLLSLHWYICIYCIFTLQGLMNQVLNDKELEDNLSFQEIQSLAVQTQIEREDISGRKQGLR